VSAATNAPPTPAKPLVAATNIVQEWRSPTARRARARRCLLTFEQPSINMLLGPSGCGKSTLLRMLGGVRPWNVATPTSGRVEIEGQACVGPHADAVMVFQHYSNRPDLTVWQNVMYPFRFQEWKRRVSVKEAEQRVEQILVEVGLADKKALFPAHLGGRTSGWPGAGAGVAAQDFVDGRALWCAGRTNAFAHAIVAGQAA
jgi:NitT/TauT family transport system ATP-binding protein